MREVVRILSKGNCEFNLQTYYSKAQIFIIGRGCNRQISTQLPIDFRTQSAKLLFAAVGKSSGSRNRILNAYVCSTSTIDILMFMALAFDTLQAAKQLQKSGIAEPQAEAIVSIVSDKHEELATKSDVEILRMDLENFREATKTDIENLSQKTEAEFKNLRQETKADIENLSRKTEAEFKNLRTELGSLRQETKADNENLRDLLKASDESVGKDRNWFRWAIGVNTAMWMLIVGYLLSQGFVPGGQ